MNTDLRADGGSWSRHLGETLRLGVPLIGAQIAQLAINTTDVLIVGHLGTDDLAAIVLASQFFFTIFILGTGFSTAAIPMAAHALAQGDNRNVRRAIRMGLWASIIYSIVALPVFLFSHDILILLGQEPVVAAKAAIYLQIMGFAMLPAQLFMGLRSFFSTMHRAGVILAITILVLLLNAVFAYIFVLGHFGMPAFGLRGAASVALGVNAFSFVAAAWYIQRDEKLRSFEIFARFWRADWHTFLDVIKIGVPIGLMVLAEVSLFTVSSLMMGWIGTVQLAAHGIAMQFASMAFMVPLGLSQAATVRVGLAAGRRNQVEIFRAGLSAILLACCFAVLGGLLFVLKRESLAALFIDRDSTNAAELLATAGPFIAVAGAFQLFDGLQAVGAGLARGLKDSTVPMILAMISYWGIGFTGAYILAFPLGFGGIGIWYGFLTGLAAAAVTLNARFFLLMKRAS